MYVMRDRTARLPTARPETRPTVAAAEAVAAAEGFADLLLAIDRGTRGQGRTLPTADERELILHVFWDGLVEILIGAATECSEREAASVAAQIRATLSPWLLRSPVWNRSLVKPHGYRGDYRILESMYDLEADACADPTQPAVCNLLDELYRSVHSVQAVWDRRRWFAGLIERSLAAHQWPLRLLDVACGGARHLRDVIDRHPEGVLEVTLIDREPAALAYVDAWLPTAAAVDCRLICGSPQAAAELVRRSTSGSRPEFDLVISTGLFDYLPAAAARWLLADMADLTAPGGTLAVCNFVPADRARIVAEWIADWPLVYRSAAELAELLPSALHPELETAPRGDLVYATAIRP
jgi:SAM-dependent methyltransferase